MDLKGDTKSPITKFGHLQIPLEDILKATNNFDDQNVIGRGELGKVYQGRLLRSRKSVKIAARRFYSKHKHGIKFLREISALSSLKHENIVSIIGFCDEQNEKVIVYKREAKGSLEMHLSKPNLTWTQRLKISIGVARALCYIHNEGSLIHLNINSSTILLNNKFEPKLSGFEYSIKHSVHRMDDVHLTAAIGTTGYIDPEIVKTGGVTHKSDIYSFGVVLLELLSARKAFIRNDDDDRFLVALAKLNSEESDIKDVVPSNRYEQIGHESGNMFTSVAKYCLKDERVQRPDMKYIVGELEKALELQLPYESSIRPSLEQLTSQLSHLKIRLDDIKLATDNFSRPYIWTTYYEIYRAEIEHWDKENLVSVEDKNKSESPKRRSTVLIKRLLHGAGEDIFLTEFEILATCKHHSIVTLLGYCNEDFEKILVVEDASNWQLYYYMANYKDKSVLTWEKRLKICLDVAYGLQYLHYEMEDQKTVISRDFSTLSIALDENFQAKIFDFEKSVFLPPNEDAHSLGLLRGTVNFTDREYLERGKLTRASDVYSFAVVLFEILCGRLATDQIYLTESKLGLPFVAHRCFREGKIMEMIDSIIREKRDDNNLIVAEGPNKDSIDTFVKIALWGLAETQDKRPTMKEVVKELEKALSFQEKQVQIQGLDQTDDGSIITHENTDNILRHLKIQLNDILLATDSFSAAYLIGYEHVHPIYKAELEHVDQKKFSLVEENIKIEPPKRRNTVLIKRLVITKYSQKESLKEIFFKEIEMLTTCMHPNIVTLLGFCDEGLEMILVYENTIKIFLDYYLRDVQKPILTWKQRLKICLDVAYGLRYLHYEMKDEKMIIHFDIRSRTIALGKNLGAQISVFRRSILIPPHQKDCTPYHKVKSGAYGYMDPVYEKTGLIKKESDVYSFGVLLCEILCGKTVQSHYEDNGKLLAYEVPRCFHEGTIKDIVDPIVKEESGDGFTLNSGPNKNSLDVFLKIAVACLEETQEKRPTIKVVIEELEKALLFQENNKDALRISLEGIQLATENFHDKNCVGGGGFGKVYKGKLPQSDNTIVAKRLDTTGGQGEKQFRNELQILFNFKHDNIISLVGYCDEPDAKIIVYEYAIRGSLDGHLKKSHLTWMKRLNICIDVATALDFLHGGDEKLATVIHRDIKPDNILLTSDWKAKLGDFGLSLTSAINNETDFVIDKACGTEGYVDPLYMKSRFLTKESDIYSFGVVLFEILCGISTFDCKKQKRVHLSVFIKNSFEKGKGKHDAIVFEKIKEEIMPEALSVFQMIAYQCLNENSEKRPKAKEVVQQLKKALELQMTREVTEHLQVLHIDQLQDSN